MTRKQKVPWLIGAGALIMGGGLAAGLVGLARASAAPAAPVFTARSLVGASTADIGQAAITFTRAYYRVVSGTPQVLVSQVVTAAELPDFGLPRLTFATAEPPLALVILRGDFDLTPGARTGLPPSTWHSRVSYIAYVINLRAGSPTLTQTSPRGGRFRRALRDPSLPDDLPIVPPKLGKTEAAPVSGPPTSSGQLPYGGVAPPVAPGPPR